MKRLAIIVLFIFMIGPSPLWSQNLREAVETNDYDQVKTLLESGVNANTSYENRITPIYLSSSPKVVGLLLAHGAKLDIRTAGSILTPIENAAENYCHEKEQRENWKKIVGLLRAAGAEYTINTAIYMNDVIFLREQLAIVGAQIN